MPPYREAGKPQVKTQKKGRLYETVCEKVRPRGNLVRISGDFKVSNIAPAQVYVGGKRQKICRVKSLNDFLLNCDTSSRNAPSPMLALNGEKWPRKAADWRPAKL